MPGTTIPSQDRLAIYDNAFRYGWALDTMDAGALAETFTPQGAIISTTGERFEGAEGVQRFGLTAFALPGHAGRQHHIQPLFFEATERGYLMTSYWMVVTWDVGSPAPRIVSLGWYRDICVRDGDTWKFAEKRIMRWDSSTAPVVPAS